jgi:predicted transcriptional regulator
LIKLLVQTKKRASNSHRGRLDIIADILQESHEGTRKTYLMYRCNLSFRQLKHYLDFLLKKGFIWTVNEDGNPNPGLFRITEKGRKFLKAYKHLKALMK